MNRSERFNERFNDQAESIYQFIDRFLVVCPRCQNKAQVLLKEMNLAQQTWLFAPRRFICSHCGELKEWQSHIVSIDKVEGHEWYFGLPLWLRISCCGQILWALNEQHLSILEEYIGAKLRTRKPYQRGTIAGALPSWMKQAKNRDEILIALTKLRAMLD